ncbi:uncharacterized protein DSM5745_10549 [Aspergillus mulundensis]|uniref:Uncharacterized protein n=1 Tax=Aspergillus mulundensis TaxID=1810919 RepID=A0A3D8QJF4_9EURO|nr:hypothetical protein DSM5745_10549 [Aspergillus mulundensis]RDW61877.1 hypothetical protein DSM5745_10549 [Aspergillus mulundensis]
MELCKRSHQQKISTGINTVNTNTTLNTNNKNTVVTMTGIQYYTLSSEVELELSTQMQRQSQSFLVTNFFWVCLGISLLFVLVFWCHKPIAKGCRRLIRRVGLHWEKPAYRRAHGDGDAGADADDERSETGFGDMNTSTTHQQPLLSRCKTLNADKYKYSHVEADLPSPPGGYPEHRLKSTNNSGQTSDRGTNTSTDEDEDGISLAISGRIDPRTGILNGIVHKPQFRPSYSAMLMPENEEAIYTDSSEEEDGDIDRPMLASGANNGDRESDGDETGEAVTELEENAELGKGWMGNWNLLEIAARGLEMLHQHDTHRPGNGGEVNTN